MRYNCLQNIIFILLWYYVVFNLHVYSDPFVKPIEESSGNNCEVEFSSVTKQQLVEYLLETQNICLKSVFLR